MKPSHVVQLQLQAVTVRTLGHVHDHGQVRPGRPELLDSAGLGDVLQRSQKHGSGRPSEVPSGFTSPRDTRAAYSQTSEVLDTFGGPKATVSKPAGIIPGHSHS